MSHRVPQQEVALSLASRIEAEALRVEGEDIGRVYVIAARDSPKSSRSAGTAKAQRRIKLVRARSWWTVAQLRGVNAAVKLSRRVGLFSISASAASAFSSAGTNGVCSARASAVFVADDAPNMRARRCTY